MRAFLRVDAEAALGQAADIDRRRKAGKPVGRLAGLPVAVKDLLCAAGELTTCASRMLENFRPPYDATVVARLQGGRRRADRQDEHGRVRHGRLDRELGLSDDAQSLGPGRACPAAPAAERRPAWPPAWRRSSIGTDTGGSIRQPAGLCGVTGLKPTYGRVSRYGLVAFASSLDQIGPLARTAEDAALLLEVIAGHDPLDSTSVDRPVPRLYANGRPTARRVCDSAWCASILAPGWTPKSSAAVREAVRVYESLGAKVKRDFAAARQVCRGDVLHHRPVRGIEQPGPLRRRALRPSHRRSSRCSPSWRPSAARLEAAGDERGSTKLDNPLVRLYRRSRAEGFRPGSEAPDHARHVCPQRRLLRRLLSQGAEGAPADPPGFRRGVRAKSI